MIHRYRGFAISDTIFPYLPLLSGLFITDDILCFCWQSTEYISLRTRFPTCKHSRKMFSLLCAKSSYFVELQNGVVISCEIIVCLKSPNSAQKLMHEATSSWLQKDVPN